MTDKELISSYLLLLKSNTEVYIHGTIESANKHIRKVIKSSLDDTLLSLDDTFNIMNQEGYYKVCNVDKKEIEKTYDKITKNME